MSTIWKVTFEYVSAIAHPKYYMGSHPIVDPFEVPDQHWTFKERNNHDEQSIRSQYDGLLKGASSGELIRNPRLYRGEEEVTWQEIVQ